MSCSSIRLVSCAIADVLPPRRCYIFTFDSLGDAHAPVARRLKDYLIREAETKKGMDKHNLSDHLVETVRVEVRLTRFTCAGVFPIES